MKHWTEADFQNWLYGLRDEDRHLIECSECRGEMDRLKLERNRIVALPEVSHEFLAAQRRRIYQRLEEPRRNVLAWRWALSAAMLLLIAGITFQQLHHTSPAISDEQLFSDLSSIEQSAEPKAIQPIHNLFEE
jgi:predicted anti-sigma-YlaC factor YlaD